MASEKSISERCDDLPVTPPSTLVTDLLARMSLQEQSLFIEKIPPEIRLKIYKYVIDSATVLYDQEWNWIEFEGGETILKHGLRIDGLQLLRVSKKIFHESIAYANCSLLEFEWRSDSYPPDDGRENVWHFFERFPPLLCHRLEKVVLFPLNMHVEELSNLVNWDPAFDPKRHLFPNLRLIEVWNDVGRGFPMSNVSGLFDHVGRLLSCPLGPKGLGSDLTFMHQTSFCPFYMHPQLVNFFHANNFVVHVKISLRISVWEQYGGWPYRHGWRKIWVDDYYKHTLEWTKDHVALTSFPDMRWHHWYQDWVISPRYQREFDFLWDRDNIGVNTLFVVCIDDATGQWGYDRHSENDESWSQEDEEGKRVLYQFNVPRYSDASYDTSIHDMLVTGELGLQSTGLKEQTEVVYSRHE